MLNIKSLVAKGLMVVGISLSSIVVANADIFNPVLVNSSAENANNRVSYFILGFVGGKYELNEEQKDAYHKSIVIALHNAENDQKVSWSSGNAWGYTVPVITYPKSSSYCREMHMDIYADNLRKVITATACHNSSTNSWVWYEGK